jgi:N6-adenosine-specific RNA methylase IME4
VSGPFRILYPDPPWQYGDRTPRGGADRHYPTMSTAEICNLHVGGVHVSKLAAENCGLFLWATWPMLAEALQVIDAWGFTYKNCAWAWVKTTKEGKDAVGLGHYTRGNTEPCLFATRGRMERISASVRQVIVEEQTLFAPRGRHSAKPQEARDRIVQLFGDVPRLELFAREPAPGWHSWGNELSPNTPAASPEEAA